MASRGINYALDHFRTHRCECCLLLQTGSSVMVFLHHLRWRHPEFRDRAREWRPGAGQLRRRMNVAAVMNVCRVEGISEFNSARWATKLGKTSFNQVACPKQALSPKSRWSSPGPPRTNWLGRHLPYSRTVGKTCTRVVLPTSLPHARFDFQTDVAQGWQSVGNLRHRLSNIFYSPDFPRFWPTFSWPTRCRRCSNGVCRSWGVERSDFKCTGCCNGQE